MIPGETVTNQYGTFEAVSDNPDGYITHKESICENCALFKLDACFTIPCLADQIHYKLIEPPKNKANETK